MCKFIDLTGKTFGRWFVVGRAKGHIQPNGRSVTMWACMCSCKGENSIKAVSGYCLVSGQSTSCGCYNRERSFEVNFINLTGKTFGRWFVRSQAEDYIRPSGKHITMWNCECSCGGKDYLKVVRGDGLVSGASASCGCITKERLSETCSGANHPSWKGGITPLNHIIRNSIRYKEWHKEVFERDSYTCQVSGVLGDGDLHVHHIKPFSQILDDNSITCWEEALKCEELWDVSNGITLLKEFHDPTWGNSNSFHKVYGTHATEEDFYMWFSEMRQQ